MSGIWLVAFLVESALLLVLLVLVAGVLRYLGQIQDRLQQAIVHVTRFGLDDAIPAFTLPDFEGHAFSSSTVIGTGRPTLLLLLTTTCASCEGVIRQVAEISSRKDFRTLGWGVILACLGNREAVDQLLERSLADSASPLAGEVAVLLDATGDLARTFQVSGLPVGMALDGRGRLVDQSPNPGPNWIYQVLGVDGPPASLVRAPTPTLQFVGDLSAQPTGRRG